MKEIRIKAPAKLNLHLQVLNKRSDGYHNISSLFTIIDFCDSITLKKNEKTIELEESAPIKDNIVLKAANLLKEKFSVKEGVSITLTKNIPDQKGLGGGSSDAASVLIGLNKIWELGLSKNELSVLALELGSDVPFFIHGKTSWAEGRGEILSNYPYKERFFLLSFPDLKMSTKQAFESLPLKKVKALKQSDYTDNKSFNSFESWIRETNAEMEKQFRKLSTLGKPRLSGTGSTIFLEFNEENSAKEVLEKFPHLVFTKSLERSPLMQIIE